MLSKQDKDLLERHRAHLIRDIGLEDGMLLAHLRARGAITRQQEEFIKAVPEEASQAGRLLDILQRGDIDTLDKLVYSLKTTGQTHVVDSWLRLPRKPDTWGPGDESAGISSANALKRSDRLILERSRPDLMQRLSLADGSVLGELRARGTLTDTEESYIKTLQYKSGNSNAVGHLINVILRKSSDSMETFLHTLNQTGHSHVVGYLRPPTTVDTKKFIRGGSSTTELEAALRHNMKGKLDDWRTAIEEGVCGQGGQLSYVQQPCTYTERGTRSEEQSGVSSTISLVEKSSSGDRIIVYGEAGMGKTTLLKHIAHSWIERNNDKLVSKFRFVFLIPMRLIGNVSLLRIICEELRLIPASNLPNLEASLDLNAKDVLFLLDSYEELRREVVNAEIDDLIFNARQSRFSDSTVIVTSRPGTKLGQTRHRKIAQLDDLPEEEVKEIIKQHLSGNDRAVREVLICFPATTFLRRPINLALFLYVLRESKRTKDSAVIMQVDSAAVTQVELLNQVLQYIMLAYAKKRGFEEFTPMPGSYLQNKDIPRDVTRLFRDIAKKCYEERKRNNVILHFRDDRDLRDYLSFGLFTAGQDDHSLVLPHPLFQEYFAAAHLAEDPKAWNALFEQIRANTEYVSPRLKRLTGESSKHQKRSLSDVLKIMGLEHVVRFVVALAPEVVYEQKDGNPIPIKQVDRICSQLGSLLVIEREELSEYPNQYRSVNAGYYTDLIRDCRCESGRRALAVALVNAPVRMAKERDREAGLPVLLQCLSYDQYAAFLKKFFNLVLSVKGNRSSLSCASGGDTVVISDPFVAALFSRYDCTINAKRLVISGSYPNYLHLPARMLSQNTTDVSHLILKICKLHAGTPNYMTTLADPLLKTPQRHPPSSSLKTIWLESVEGLEHCHTITPSQCHLKINYCGDVKIRTLNTCFPKLLELDSDNITLVHETEEELISWLEAVHTVERLNEPRFRAFKFAPRVNGMSLNLCPLLNILAEKTKIVCLKSYRLLLAAGRATVKQSRLSELILQNCHGGVDLGQVLEVCSRCMALERLMVVGCKLQASSIDTSGTVQRNGTLTELLIEECDGDFVQLLVICSECPNLKYAYMERGNIIFDEEKIEFVKPLPRLRQFLWSSTNVSTPNGEKVECEVIAQHLQRLCPSALITDNVCLGIADFKCRLLMV